MVPAPASAPVLPPAGEGTAGGGRGGARLPRPRRRRPAAAGARDPAAILSGAPVPAAGASATVPQRSTALGGEPFVFFVQAGAFTRNEDAEQQRAKLALMGQVAQISEREQAGRMVYRVRMGPFKTRDDADALLVKLQAAAVEAQIVRVERP
ncbi:MAG: SPOR domain-containing protein [Rubrivivax sp.]